MARRYCALWFPFLPTDRLRRREYGARAERSGSAGSEGRAVPLVVVETVRNAVRLVSCDRNAIKLGLAPGLTLADARARIPALTVVEADHAADRRLVEWLAAFCDRYTPLIGLDPPDGLHLDITGCATLFGGEDELLGLVGERMRRFGLSLRAAVAGTPDAARAVCRFGPGGIVPAGSDAPWTRLLPIAALGMPAETVTALSRAGLKTLADLVDRPSSTLAARFGADLTIRLRRTLGQEDIRITPLRPPPACIVERHFSEPLLEPAGLEAAIAQLVAEAARHLEARGEGGRAFEIAFFRSDGAVRRLRLETGRPCREAATLLRLYREHCAVLADPLDPGFGFDAIRLSVPICEPLRDAQPSLDRQAPEDAVVSDLVDRLVARLGRERVLRFLARDTHDPAREARAVSATGGPRTGASWREPEPGEPPLRPLQLFEPPQPIETLSEVPDGPPRRFRWRRVLHDIVHAEGPERIAPEWWRTGPDEPARDYYRVEDTQGRRFWLFRAGLHEDGAPPPNWYLHGLFA